jgi:8-oxo-dGTP diphosphatase
MLHGEAGLLVSGLTNPSSSLCNGPAPGPSEEGAVVYLVRHAHAGHKDTWIARDTLRPLSASGRDEAAGLVVTLRHLPVSRILSSPATRCLQTVQPLARQRQLPIEVDGDLGVDAGPVHALELLEQLGLSEAVVCSHGELIGKVMERLVAGGLRPDGPLRWPKGSIWLLDRDHAGGLRGSYLPPVRVPAAACP